MNQADEMKAGGNPDEAGPSRMDLEELTEQVRQVRSVASVALGCVVAAFLSLDLLWYLQIKAVQQDLEKIVEASQQMRQALMEYQSNVAPRIIAFVRDLTEYAQKDPEFAKILGRYPKFSEVHPAGTNVISSANSKR